MVHHFWHVRLYYFTQAKRTKSRGPALFLMYMAGAYTGLSHQSTQEFGG